MPRAQGQRSYLAYAQEPELGATLTTPAMRLLRNTGSSGVEVQRSTLESAEYRKDRAVADFRLGNKTPTMDVPFEFSFASYDDLLEGAMFGRFLPATGANKITAAVQVIIDAAAKTLTRASGSFLTDGFAVGDYVILGGFVNVANRITVRITALSATVMTCSESVSLVNETLATGATFDRWQGLPVQLGATTLAVAATGKTITRSAGSFIADGVQVGDIVVTTGFAQGGNNGRFKVSAVAALVLTFATATGLVDEAAKANCAYYSDRRILKQGTQFKSFLVEEGFEDVGQYQTCKGVAVNEMNLNVAPNAMVTGGFSLLGLIASAFSQTPVDASPDVMAATSPFDSFTGSLTEGGASGAHVTSLSFKGANGLEQLYELFNANVFDISAGRARFTGSLSLYFADTVIANKFFNETETALSFTLIDLLGNAYKFTLPRVKYTALKKNKTETTVAIDVPWAGLYDSVTQTACIIEKMPAA